MSVQLDNRLPNQVRYYFPKKGEDLMLVPEPVRDCIVFVGRKKNAAIKEGGTAFCAAINEGGESFSYFVTAKHNIDYIQKEGDDGKVHLRMNFFGSDAKFVETEIKDWFFHPTESEKVDVAVYPIQQHQEMAGLRKRVSNIVLGDGVVNDELIRKYGIGPGDEVFITGLFVHHVGKSNIIPIVRVGNIAAIPSDPIYPGWCDPHPMQAYLIEARSIGGLSGSPVFVLNDAGGLEHTIRKTFFLFFGLVHGHWGFRVPDVADTDVDEDGDDVDVETKKINAGIAIVVPSAKILETLNHPDLAAYRRQFIADRQKEKSDLAVPD